MLKEKYKMVDNIIDKHGRNPAVLIAMLQEIQEELRYLPEEVLVYLAKALGVTESRIYGIATFYENFSLEPKGKYIIKICDGTACHVKKSTDILDALRRELDLNEKKHTTNDMMFTVETVSCIGACGLAPVITINGKVYAKVTPGSTVDLIKSIRQEEASL